jgi:hypothetical protein
MAWIAAAISAVGGVVAAKQRSAANSIGMGQGMQAATDARTSEAVFDNSGWNVSFGSSKIDSTASKTIAQEGPAPSTNMAATPVGYGQPGISASLPALNSSNMLTYAAIAGIFLIVWKKRKN